MKALTYLLKTTIINYFKRLKKKPQKAVGPIFIIIWFSFMFLANGFSRENQNTYTAAPKTFVSIFVLFTLAMFIYCLYSGTKKVNSKFTMADVNLIFVSPIRPQTIMIYGIIKQIAVELLASMYLLYQIPNFLRNYKVTTGELILIMLAYLLFQLVFCNIIKLFIFALSTKVKGLGQWIRNFIRIMLVLLAGGGVLLIIQGRAMDFIEGFTNELTYSSGIKYIPIFGWLRELALQSVTGIKVSFIFYMLMLVLLSALILYITYSMDIDFYEDMLTSAEANDIIKEAKSGKRVYKDGKQSKFLKPFRNRKLNLENIYGAGVLFKKHMNEYMKRSFVFFINTYSLILILVSFILGIFAKGADIKGIYIVASVILFFTVGFGGKIYVEISNPFIFILPDSPQKKLFYATASSLIKIFTDALFLFLPFGILAKVSPFEIILAILCYLILGAMLSYSGLVAFRICNFLGFTGPLAQGVFFMLFQLILMVPGIIIAIVSTIALSIFSGYGLYLGMLIYTLGGTVLFSLGGVGIFNDMEI